MNSPRLLLLIMSLFCITSSTIYYVIPEGDSNLNTTTNNSYTLHHYVNNTEKYFTSNTQLHFLSGQHYLSKDLVFKDVEKFSVTGGDHCCTITCISPVSIVLINVTNFKLTKISLINCTKMHALYKLAKEQDIALTNDLMSPNNITAYNSTVLLYHCTSVIIDKVDITVNTGSVGLLAVNAQGSSRIAHLKVKVNCLLLLNARLTLISGILLYYNDWNTRHNATTNFDIDDLQYITNGSCTENVITLLLFQKKYNIHISILNAIFRDLHNSTALYYYGETCGFNAVNNISIINCTIRDNTGNPELKMFDIVLYNSDCFSNINLFKYCKQQHSYVYFVNCTFTNNTDMETMIYVTPANSRAITGYLKVHKGGFFNNQNTSFIKVKAKVEIVWQLTTYFRVQSLNASYNKHDDGEGLITMSNGVMHFTGQTHFIKNDYYKTLLKAHVSVVICEGYVELTGNHARQILTAKSGSYFLLLENTVFNMSKNVVYTTAKQIRTIGDNSQPICPVQFYSTKRNPSGNINNLYKSFKILMLDNVHMLAKDLPGEDMSFGNCTWLAGTAFQGVKAQVVYQNILKVVNIPVNITTKRVIPLHVCQCSSLTNKSDCYSAILGSIFPGQTLIVQLIVAKQWLNYYRSSATIIVANTPDDNCSIVDSYQLSQTHFNHGCNNYSYTIWPSSMNRTECELYIGLYGMPEMFYVRIKPCPKGFTLQKDKKACYCDPLLDNDILSITQCNLNTMTILRPGNSWITADTVSNDNYAQHTYHLSQHCPFDYCLPNSIHLNLANPDAQCQFNRTGRLCGHCKQGLSAVFGSSHCKQCSNVYLLIVVPLAIAGVVFVIILFIFNLTVICETINTFVFYVNVVNINITVFFPSCHSAMCIILSLFNLDLGIETCFYSGMDDYAKAWFQLLFPLYLIVIANLLIVTSRHYTVIQRLTARRALPVLATLFLLSYIKILQNVCNALFMYFELTTLPEKHTKLVWSVDTNAALFGVKFSTMFVISSILLMILLLFNVVLLFTRKLMYFKFITTFKPILDAYFAPYKDKLYYWTGLLLLVRVIIYAFSALDKDASLVASSILLGGLLCLQGIVQPFKNRFQNYQESLVLFNLLAIHVTSLYMYNSKNERAGLNIQQILFTTAIVYFAVAITFHCCMSTCKNAIKKQYEKMYCTVKALWKKGSSKPKDDLIEMDSLSKRISDVTYNYREFQEPLIEFDK